MGEFKLKMKIIYCLLVGRYTRGRDVIWTWGKPGVVIVLNTTNDTVNLRTGETYVAKETTEEKLERYMKDDSVSIAKFVMTMKELDEEEKEKYENN
jgi:hypothetical protein